MSLFQKNPGLKRSIDKMYEILVYALFTAIVRALKVRITMEIGNPDKEMLKDFDEFIKRVLGFTPKTTQIIMNAALFRAGVANAADRGLDMWTNFGAAIQVKHIALTPDILEDISDDISADRIVIVCLTSEKNVIEAVLKQVGWGGKIQGVITIDDLENLVEFLRTGSLSEVVKSYSFNCPDRMISFSNYMTLPPNNLKLRRNTDLPVSAIDLIERTQKYFYGEQGKT